MILAILVRPNMVVFLQMLHLIAVPAAVLCVFVARVAIPVIPELGQL